MRGFVRIAVNVPSLAGVFVSGRASTPATFDYSLPASLSGRIQAGHLVRVPFGGRTVQGLVLALIDEPAVADTKDVIELVDPEPALTGAQIALAEWMAEDTLNPIASIVGLFLPPGLGQQADMLFSIRNPDLAARKAETVGVSGSAADNSGGSTAAARLVKLLAQRGPLRGRQIDRALTHLEWRRTAQNLVRAGVLSSRSVLPPASARPKYVRTAQLAVRPEVAQSAISDLGTSQATRARRQKALAFLISRPEAISVSWVYAESGCNLADLQALADRELIILREHEIWRDPLEKMEPVIPAGQELPLTAEQLRAWDSIEAGFAESAAGKPVKPFLLQGVTGSGKTELYLRAALETMRKGRQVIVLVPEISLTPQTVRRFLAHFPGQVGLIHSQLSDGERYDTWRRGRAGLLKVNIGARSALFAPLPNVGLVVIDECHDASYHQSEPPFYDAVSAAQAYARICGGLCILGSATPSVAQRYQIESGRGVRLELTERIASESAGSPAPMLHLPPVQIVDMRDELKAGNRGSFSRELSASLTGVLRRGEQAILFLNRRGTATYVFCRNCGYVVRCPRCETPLTYHVAGGEKLRCHRCGYERQMPKRCPECGEASIRAYGLGTEKVEAEVQRAFPAARTLRWDWETTRQKQAHEIILQHFVAGRADVLIGTQMLAKGLDLPRVTLVGIVLADVGLYLPDPFAVERVFQLLTQVAGRAGRSTRGGRAVLQTFSPEHYAIRAAAQHDVNGFHAQELVQRRRLGYPPFSHLIRLEYRHHESKRAEQEARAAASRLRTRLAQEGGNDANMIGPAPAFYSKLDGKYRWQIILRGSDPRQLVVGGHFTGWRIEVDPSNLL